MATTESYGSHDGANVDIERTIVLTPEHAKHVAAFLIDDSTYEVEGLEGASSREEFERLQTTLQEMAAKLKKRETVLNAVRWGEVTSDVPLTLTVQELEDMAARLMYDVLSGGAVQLDASDPGADALRLREDLRKAEAGAAIVDQLEATR